MAVKEGSNRLIITLPDSIRSKLEYSCEKDMRSKSKQVEYILQFYFDNVIKDMFTTEEYKYFHENVFDYERKRLMEKLASMSPYINYNKD